MTLDQRLAQLSLFPSLTRDLSPKFSLKPLRTDFINFPPFNLRLFRVTQPFLLHNSRRLIAMHFLKFICLTFEGERTARPESGVE